MVSEMAAIANVLNIDIVFCNEERSLPSFRSHMMMSFIEVTHIGSVICKLSIIAIISPHTLISENTPGMTDTKNTVLKMTKARMSAKIFCWRLNVSSGQRPIIFRVNRLIPTAHSKSVQSIAILAPASVSNSTMYSINISYFEFSTDSKISYFFCRHIKKVENKKNDFYISLIRFLDIHVVLNAMPNIFL